MLVVSRCKKVSGSAESNLILHDGDALSFKPGHGPKTRVQIRRNPQLPSDFDTRDLEYPDLRGKEATSVLLEDWRLVRNLNSQNRKRHLEPDVQGQDIDNAEEDDNPGEQPDLTIDDRMREWASEISELGAPIKQTKQEVRSSREVALQPTRELNDAYHSKVSSIEDGWINDKYDVNEYLTSLATAQEEHEAATEVEKDRLVDLHSNDLPTRRLRNLESRLANLKADRASDWFDYFQTEAERCRARVLP